MHYIKLIITIHLVIPEDQSFEFTMFLIKTIVIEGEKEIS